MSDQLYSRNKELRVKEVYFKERVFESFSDRKEISNYE